MYQCLGLLVSSLINLLVEYFQSVQRKVSTQMHSPINLVIPSFLRLVGGDRQLSFSVTVCVIRSQPKRVLLKG